MIPQHLATLLVTGTRERLQFILSGYSLTVVFSAMQEDCYLLMVSGEPDELNEFIEELHDFGLLYNVPLHLPFNAKESYRD